MSTKNTELHTHYDFYFLLFLAAHIAIWTLIPTMLRTVGSSMDMVENFVWGKEFQLGYYKHPPFFAWVVGAWFYLFSINDFFYFLLCQVNSAVGFIFIYLLSQQILDKKRALIAVVLLAFVPSYNFLSLNFNANTILLSVWPALAFFFYKALKEESAINWIFTGVLAGAALLSKYYSITLFAAMALILFKRDKFNFVTTLKNKGLYLALGACFIVVFPHLKWIVDNDFSTLRYASLVQQQFTLKGSKNPFNFFITQIVYLSAVILIGHFLFKIRRAHFLKSNVSEFDSAFLCSITFIPFILTFVVGVIFSLGTKPDWGIPLWFLFGTLVMTKVNPTNAQMISLRNLTITLFLMFLGYLGVMKTIKNPSSLPGKQLSLPFPGKTLASFVTETWRARYQSKLQYIAGYFRPAQPVSFYSDDHPSVLIDFNYSYSPWMKENDVKKHGIAIICDAVDESCKAEAVKTFKVDIKWEILDMKNYKFTFGFIGPSSHS